MALPAPGGEKSWRNIRRQSIVDAVVRLLSREGSATFTMDHVAEEAGITKATIYSYFKNKEELLEMVRSESIEPLQVELAELLSSDLAPEVRLQYVTSRILSYFDRNRETIRILHMERTEVPVRKYSHSKYLAFIEDMASLFSEGVAQGVFRDLDPRGLAFFYVESITGIISYRIFSEDTSPVEEITRVFLEVFLHGVLSSADHAKVERER